MTFWVTFFDIYQKCDVITSNIVRYWLIWMRVFSKKATTNLLTQRNRYNLFLHEYQVYDLLKKYQVPLVPVSISKYRVSERIHLRMLLRSLIEWWLESIKIELLWTLSSRHRFMPEVEEKDSSRNRDSRVEFRLPPEQLKFLIILKKC